MSRNEPGEVGEGDTGGRESKGKGKGRPRRRGPGTWEDLSPFREARGGVGREAAGDSCCPVTLAHCGREAGLVPSYPGSMRGF